MKTFISYRRDDSAPYARLIRHELVARFGEDAVFMDVDDIQPGDDFARLIDANLADGDAVVVVIGPRWAQIIAEREGGPDYVRHEVRAALARRATGANVVPVCVGGAPWPQGALPADIDDLDKLSAVVFDPRLPGAGDAVVNAVRRQTPAQIEAFQRNLRRASAWSVAIGLVAFVLAWTGLFEVAAFDTYAHRAINAVAALLGPQSAPGAPRVAVVMVDGERIERPTPPWRAELATVVDRAAAAGARVLAIDMVLERPGDPAADAQLEQSLRTAREKLPVVLAVGTFRDGRPLLHAPFAAQAGWGVACVHVREQTVVALPLVARRGDAAKRELWPSLGLAAFIGRPPATGLDPAQLDVLDLALPVPAATGGTVTVRGFFSRVLRSVSPNCGSLERGDFVVYQWLDGRATAPERVAVTVRWEQVLAGDPAALRALEGRHVLIGARDPEDEHRVAGGSVRAGVYLVAAQLDGLLRGPVVRPLPGWAHALALVLLAGAGARLAGWLWPLRRRRAWWPALAAIALLWLLLCVLLYRAEAVLVSPLYGLLALVAGAWLGRRMVWR